MPIVLYTIDHQIMLSRLHDMYGIRNDVHAWFKLYLSDRTQCVNINGVLLDTKKLTFGVPQGSVFGPTLYCMYKQTSLRHYRKRMTLNSILCYCP